MPSGRHILVRRPSPEAGEAHRLPESQIDVLLVDEVVRLGVYLCWGPVVLSLWGLSRESCQAALRPLAFLRARGTQIGG